jgi:RNA polymerase sigma-70 factor (ECF subfamily)
MHLNPARSREFQEEGSGQGLNEGAHGIQPRDSPSDFIDAALEEERTRLLLGRVAQGNTLAFWMLWDLYKGHLYRLCLWQMGGVQADAEDALSRAMLRALEKLPNNACKIGNCKAWLNRLTLNLCVDMHRERKRQVRRLESIDNSLRGASGRVAASTDSPEQGLINREVFAHVCSAINNLPPRLREPFVLRFFQEMDYREIAERLILSPDNVRKRIQQARDILREELSRFLQGSVSPRAGIAANVSVLPKSASPLVCYFHKRPFESVSSSNE